MLCRIFDDDAHAFEVFYTSIGHTCTKHANLHYDLIAEIIVNFSIISHAMEVGIQQHDLIASSGKSIGCGRIGKAGY